MIRTRTREAPLRPGASGYARSRPYPVMTRHAPIFRTSVGLVLVLGMLAVRVRSYFASDDFSCERNGAQLRIMTQLNQFVLCCDVYHRTKSPFRVDWHQTSGPGTTPWDHFDGNK